MAPGTGDLAQAAVDSRDASVARPDRRSAEHVATALPPRLYGGGALKRAFDIVASVAFLIVTAPLFALIAVAIKLDTLGPVFFHQERLGRGGKPFLMWKFRKMPVDLPTQGPLLTRRSDPRLTRVGRWL